MAVNSTQQVRMREACWVRIRIPFKVLLYDDVVGVVSSGHVIKMATKSFDPL